jgi:hypothetical protein
MPIRVGVLSPSQAPSLALAYVPAIHVLHGANEKKDVDARVKPGHDEFVESVDHIHWQRVDLRRERGSGATIVARPLPISPSSHA